MLAGHTPDIQRALHARVFVRVRARSYRSAEQKLAGDLVSKTNSNAALKQILALVVARKDQLEKDIVAVGEADKAYTKQLASEQTPDPTVTGVTGCPGGTCSAHGGVDHVVTLKGCACLRCTMHAFAEECTIDPWPIGPPAGRPSTHSAT